jgi:hypothetical protein
MLSVFVSFDVTLLSDGPDEQRPRIAPSAYCTCTNIATEAQIAPTSEQPGGPTLPFKTAPHDHPQALGNATQAYVALAPAPLLLERFLCPHGHLDVHGKARP